MNIFDKFSKELISKYKTKSLFFEYFMHILITVTIPIIMLVTVIIVLFTSTYRMNTSSHAQSSAQKTAAYFDTLFSQIDAYYKKCIASNDVFTLISNPNSINNVVESASPIAGAGSIASYLQLYTNCIDSIYLYNINYNYVYGFLGTASNTFENYDNKTWYDEYIKRNKSDYITTTEFNGVKYLTFCYNLGYPKRNPGLLVINISESSILEKIGFDETKDEKFRLISSSTNEIFMNYLLDVSASEVIAIQLEKAPVTLLYSSNISYPFKMTYNLIMIIICTLIFIILSIVLAYTFARKQYNSILHVITAMENSELQSNVSSQNELYFLLEKAHAIATEKNDIENNLLEKITHLKQTQAIALQTQITPHFLFNTLNMINYSILENCKEDTEAVKMITLLSDVLRYSLKADEYIVNIMSEINAVRSYVEILMLKYQDSFTVKWNIEPGIEHEKTIKSVIQPLVENAVEHGIKLLFKSKPGELCVNIYKNQNKLYINVTDNGVGMTDNELADLKKQLDSEFLFKNKNIGLKNVVDRIKLLFNNNNGYSITSNRSGTSITIYHPIIKN